MVREQARSYGISNPIIVGAGLPANAHGKRTPTERTQMKTKTRIYHGKDLRKGRVSESGRIYLLTTVTHRRKPVFRDITAGHILVDEFNSISVSGLADNLAWIIMPDHFHWLITLNNIRLDQLMRQVKSRSAIAINKYLKTGSKFWQKGYHDHALRKDEDVRTVAQYMIENPIRAGLVENIDDYPLWGSIWNL